MYGCANGKWGTIIRRESKKIVVQCRHVEFSGRRSRADCQRFASRFEGRGPRLVTLRFRGLLRCSFIKRDERDRIRSLPPSSPKMAISRNHVPLGWSTTAFTTRDDSSEQGLYTRINGSRLYPSLFDRSKSKRKDPSPRRGEHIYIYIHRMFIKREWMKKVHIQYVSDKAQSTSCCKHFKFVVR